PERDESGSVARLRSRVKRPGLRRTSMGRARHADERGSYLGSPRGGPRMNRRSNVGASSGRASGVACGPEEHPQRRGRATAVSEDAYARAAALFRAAGDVARLKLLDRLSEGEWCVTELAEAAG